MADVSRIRELLLALPIRVESVDLADALGEVTELARSLQLTAYDAAYVALAARLGLPLATADQRLIAACSVAGVSVVE
jgi:predicted nucleic acid-binding protein